MLKVVGLGRVELPTSRLSGVRSNHLSYRPSCRPGLSPGPSRRASPAGSDFRRQQNTPPISRSTEAVLVSCPSEVPARPEPCVADPELRKSKRKNSVRVEESA